MKRILIDCGIQYERSAEMWCDNKSSMAIARNPTLPGRTKHIDVKIHFLLDLVIDQEVNLNYCKTDEEVVDLFAKCLSVQSHCKFRELLGMCKLQSRGRLSA